MIDVACACTFNSYRTTLASAYVVPAACSCILQVSYACAPELSFFQDPCLSARLLELHELLQESSDRVVFMHVWRDII